MEKCDFLANNSTGKNWRKKQDFLWIFSHFFLLQFGPFDEEDFPGEQGLGEELWEAQHQPQLPRQK